MISKVIRIAIVAGLLLHVIDALQHKAVVGTAHHQGAIGSHSRAVARHSRGVARKIGTNPIEGLWGHVRRAVGFEAHDNVHDLEVDSNASGTPIDIPVYDRKRVGQSLDDVAKGAKAAVALLNGTLVHAGAADVSLDFLGNMADSAVNSILSDIEGRFNETLAADVTTKAGKDVVGCSKDGCTNESVKDHNSFIGKFEVAVAERKEDDNDVLNEVVKSAKHTDDFNHSRLQTATCQEGSPGCKSMCRWLKISDQDFQNGRCPLFERPLASCGWVAPELRAEGALPLLGDMDFSTLDCAVNCLRANVVEDDVQTYVARLEECTDSLPSGVNDTCIIALSLITSEVADWRMEAQLKADSEALGEGLAVAIAHAKAVLETQSGYTHVIEELSSLLARAEALPGHYLTTEVHEARSFLDRLAPIPAVVEELYRALADARHALATQQPFAVTEGIVWLKAVLRKAQRFEVGDPVPEGQAIYQQLLDLQTAQEALRLATFAGNVSLSTKSEIPTAISVLHNTINVARASNLSTVSASSLVSSLKMLQDSIEASVSATAAARLILDAHGLKGKTELTAAALRLNHTIVRARDLGLQDDNSTLDSLETLEDLEYILHARKAVHSSIRHGQRVLQEHATELSDDAEEVAIDTLKPAIEWGEEVGLIKGLPVAREIVSQLENVESAKENMSKALAVGNASIMVKADEDQAIAELAESIATFARFHLTGGIPEAQEMLKLLATRKVARGALKLATEMAKDSFEARTGEMRAIVALNASIQEADEAGLRNEAKAEREQLKQLELFRITRQNLTRALTLTTPEPSRPGPIEVNDTEPLVSFNRAGYRVVSSPLPEGSVDDGDDDFDEHISVLRMAVARLRRRGEVDPGLEAMLTHARAKGDAYALIDHAIAVANESESTKTHIDDAILELTMALQEAGETDLELDVTRAQELLQQLNTIKPARDELDAAILQANVSRHTVSGMDSALSRLNRATAICEELHLFMWLPAAYTIRDELVEVRTVFMRLKAAIMQGEIALEAEQGEDAAIDELNEAVKTAGNIQMHRELPVALDLLNELAHMNAEHQQMQAAMTPGL